MARALHVLADLSLALDDEDIAIRGDGDRIVVDLPSLAAGRKLLQAGPFSPSQRRSGLAKVNTVLRETGLTIEFHYAGEAIARLGTEARPGAIAQALNLGDVEVRPAQSLRAAARRRPALTLGLAAALAALLSFLFFWRSRDD